MNAAVQIENSQDGPLLQAAPANVTPGAISEQSGHLVHNTVLMTLIHI